MKENLFDKAPCGISPKFHFNIQGRNQTGYVLRYILKKYTLFTDGGGTMIPNVDSLAVSRILYGQYRYSKYNSHISGTFLLTLLFCFLLQISRECQYNSLISITWYWHSSYQESTAAFFLCTSLYIFDW